MKTFQINVVSCKKLSTSAVCRESVTEQETTISKNKQQFKDQFKF